LVKIRELIEKRKNEKLKLSFELITAFKINNLLYFHLVIQSIMKITLLNILLFGILFISSCKKDTAAKSTNLPTNPNSFTLKKDGLGFNPGYIEASDPFEFSVAVSAAATPQSNANVYNFLMDKTIPIGTYNYETLMEEYNCWFSYSAPNFDLCYINDGTFQIIQQDTIQKILEMKFQFEMEDSNEQIYQVTEGHFKVHY
jgi:hypothetical protein